MKYDYIELPTGKGEWVSYIRRDRLQELSQVDMVIFDCDGVLLDVRESYRVAVEETTRILLQAFTGTVIPEGIIDPQTFFAFKRTGGFNNDWDLTYALLMGSLAQLSAPTLIEIDNVAKESLRHDNISKRLEFIKEDGRKAGIDLKKLQKSLITFAASLNSNGIKSVDELVLDQIGLNVKLALNHRGEVGESIIATLFEEVFSGTTLFEETFNKQAQVTARETGFIENEKVVVTNETLSSLSEILRGNRLGIASGSLHNSATHALGNILSRFQRSSQVWHDDVDQEIRETGRSNLHKPNPYPLKRASRPYEPFNAALYLGDTKADELMVQNTRKKDDRYFFCGVYQTVSPSMEVRDMFLEVGCDLLIPNVNELPEILNWIRSEAQ